MCMCRTWYVNIRRHKPGRPGRHARAYIRAHRHRHARAAWMFYVL